MLDRVYVRNLTGKINGVPEISQSTIAYFRHPEHLIEFLGLVGEALEADTRKCNNKHNCDEFCKHIQCPIALLDRLKPPKAPPKNCSACVVFDGGDYASNRITHETAMKIKELLK